MQYSQIVNILKSSVADDWLFSDERGIYAYKKDVNLRIVRNDIDFDRDKFSGEDWAVKHPDSSAYKVVFSVFYGQSFIEDHTLVHVDGFRATLPMPKFGTNVVPWEDYHFATILEKGSSLDEYMRRAKLTVEEVGNDLPF